MSQPENKSIVTCGACDRKFQTETDLEWHWKSQPYCAVKTYQAPSLAQPVSTHSALECRNHLCLQIGHEESRRARQGYAGITRTVFKQEQPSAPHWKGGNLGDVVPVTPPPTRATYKDLIYHDNPFLLSAVLRASAHKLLEDGPGISRLDLKKPSPPDFSGWVDEIDLLPDAD